jgi:hypothetical protein
MTANEHQVGNTHYKGFPIEHWDFVLMHKMPYMEAQIFKYVLRWKEKNGLEDLRKAKHFLEKLIEYELGAQVEVTTGPGATGDVLAQEAATLEECREALSTKDGMDKFMADSGVPRSKGYVDQD